MGKVNGIDTPFDDAIVKPAAAASSTNGQQGGFDLADGRQATGGETGTGVNFVTVRDQPSSVKSAGASIKGS